LNSHLDFPQYQNKQCFGHELPGSRIIESKLRYI